MSDEETTIVEVVEVTPDDSWFESDFSKQVSSALISGFMSDLTVKVQDGDIRCHSLVLGTASPKLAEKIRKSPHKIKLPKVKSTTFKTILQIIYSGEAEEMKTDVTKILDVVKVAHDLKIYKAFNFCTKLLRQLLDATNVCSILDMACHLDIVELKVASTYVIRDQTDDVLKSEGFLKCDVATLEIILKQELVHNVTELDLLQALDRWAKTHDNPRQALGSTLSLIRFRTFTTEDIAAYVKPTKLLTDKEEHDLLWYLLAKGKGEMPAGFSNEMRKRLTTSIMEHIRASTEESTIYGSGDALYRTKEEQLATPPLRFTVNEDAFLIGVKPGTERQGKIHGDKYKEDTEVTLKDDKGTLISTATFSGEVTKGTWYKMTFPHPVQLCADATYALHFINTESGVRHWIFRRKKLVCETKTTLNISVLEEVESSIVFLIIAPRIQ